MQFFFSPSCAAKKTCLLYEQIAKDFSKTREKMEWDELEHFAAQTKDSSAILDVGCGSGRLMDILPLGKKNITYTGVDLSGSLLQIAQQQFPEGNFLQADFSFLPFGDELFDEVWAVASFHHLPSDKDRRKALREAWRVLKKDGSVIITVWNLWEQQKYTKQKSQAEFRAFLSPLWTTRDFLIPWGTEKRMRYYFSFSDVHLRELFESEGFFVEECFFSRGRKNICIRAVKKHKKNTRVHLFGIPIDALSFEEVLCMMEKTERQPLFITTPNPEMFVEAEKNAQFQKILISADISLPDGTGLLWASGASFLRGKKGLWLWIFAIFSLFLFAFGRKHFSRSIQNTVCGSDIFHAFLERSEQKKSHDIFLIGGARGSALSLAEKFPNAVCGIEDGKISIEKNSELCEKIVNCGAKVLFVALGAPKQEFWISHNIELLQNIRFVMGVGGSFDFISGLQKRAPLFCRKMGLEWLWRLFKEPKRIKRIWNAIVRFPFMVMRRLNEQ
jgi:N-acetylglucosaminyldiphosphoundecaprenol N-acetyl-beta-D-mannosaminyltransferase